jgi:chitodextrinase
MMRRIHPPAGACAALLVMSALVLGASSAFAQSRDRTPPTRPTNLRVVSTTSYSVTLAWTPSTDNSGSFRYVICCAHTSSETIPGGGSTYTYTKGLEAARSFSLFIQAVDAAGNYSKQSNNVTFTLPADRIPPTKPTVTAKDVGPTHASLAWSSTDDGPHVWYSVASNGTTVSVGSRATSGTFALLEPQTTYTFTVQARDFGGNRSPISDPVQVTTAAANPNDVTAPTPPARLNEMHWDDGEIHLTWEQSTDDFDPQWIIRYDVHVNGVLGDIAVGSGRSIVYGTAGANTITVAATDTAGNTSAAAAIVVVLP